MLTRRLLSFFTATALAGCLVTIDDGSIPSAGGAGGQLGGSGGQTSSSSGNASAGGGNASASSANTSASSATATAASAGGGTVSSSSASTGGSGGSSPCPAMMVFVPAKVAGQPASCVDSTEVTVTAYGAFVASSPDLSNLPSVCNWKNTLSPKPMLAVDPSAPVTQIDWCDAYAYCTAAGKRLCGKTGGGTNPFDSGLDASASEWFNACSKGGTLAFPYGASYVGASCVGADYDGTPGYQAATDGLRPVLEAQACQGGFPGLFGMSGNAEELEDSCTSLGGGCPAQPGGGPACDWCRARGGSYGRLPGGVGDGLACADSDSEQRSARFDDMSFRCCATPN